MTKKAKIWTGVGVGTGVVALGLGLGLGLGLKSSPSFDKVNVVTFNVKQSSTMYVAGNKPLEVNAWSADVNQNALEKTQQYEDGLTVSQLQYDFDRALTKFYAAMEKKENGLETEIEHDMEDGERGIQVIKKNADGSFELRVRLEKEYDRSLSARDREQIQFVTIKNWKPQFELMSKADILQLTQKLVTFNKDIHTNNGIKIDLEDIAEIYLGDDWNEPWDKDYDNYFDDDDIGIFDQISSINKEYDNLAYLVSYKVDMNSFAEQLKAATPANSSINRAISTFLQSRSVKANNVDLNTTFLLPSLALNGAIALVPNEKPSFTFDNVLDRSQFNAVFAKSTLTPADNEFEYIFGHSSQQWKDSVDNVITDASNGTVTVSYKDGHTPDQIVIGQTWNLKSPA